MLKTEKEVFREFTNAWSINDADTIITFDDFYAYYSVQYPQMRLIVQDISPCITRDEDFERLIKSVWSFK